MRRSPLPTVWPLARPPREIGAASSFGMPSSLMRWFTYFALCINTPLCPLCETSGRGAAAGHARRRRRNKVGGALVTSHWGTGSSEL